MRRASYTARRRAAGGVRRVPAEELRIFDAVAPGVLPGILIGVFLMAYAVFYCVRKGEDREKINERLAELKSNGVWALFKESFWALLCPVIVLGGIYSGMFTPTEAATVSVVYALIVALFIYKAITIHELPGLMKSAVKTYGGLAFVLAFATAFGRVLSLTKATSIVTNFLTTNFHTSISLLTVLVIIFLILGMVMDTGPAIIILSPVLLPAVQKMGVDPVHFGVILVCCLSIGLATPPFGLDLFVAANLSEEKPMAVAKKALPFMIAFAIALFLITYIPWFSTALLGR